MANCGKRNAYTDAFVDDVIDLLKNKEENKFRTANQQFYNLHKHLTPQNIKSALAESGVNVSTIDDVMNLSFSQYRTFTTKLKNLITASISERLAKYESALSELKGKVSIAKEFADLAKMKKSTKTLFIVSDNTHDRTVTNIGNDLRSLENTFGFDLSKSKDEAFTDEDFEAFKERVDEVFEDLIIKSAEKGMKIVIPKSFLTQMAKLRDSAPDLFDYLQEKIDVLMENMALESSVMDSLNEKPINIYAGKNENTILSNFAKFTNSFTFQRGVTKRNAKHYQMYSGGAEGSDRIWGEVAVEFGVDSNNINHYYGEGHKTPYGNRPLTEKQLSEADKTLDEVAKTLGRNIENIKKNSPYKYSLLRRNYHQVKNATSVLAISSFKRDANGKLTNQVNGGTAYAVQFGIEKGIPVYLFDQEQGKWFEHAGQGVWEEYDGIPEPTSNFAGIGTEEINQAGENAIRGVFEQHVNQNTGEVAGIDLSGHTIYSVEHGFQLAKYKYALDKGAITKAEFNKAVALLDEAGKIENPLKSGSELRSIAKKVPIKNFDEKMGDWSKAPFGKRYSVAEQVMYQLIETRLNNDPEFRKALEDTKLTPLTHNEELSEWKTKFPKILDRLRRKHFYDNSKVGLENMSRKAAENANKAEALESLTKKRSEKIGTPIEPTTDKASQVLSTFFPDMRDRIAYINFVHNLFTSTVELSAMDYMESLKEKIDDGTATQEDIDNYDKLNISDVATYRYEYLQMAAKGKFKLQSIFADMQNMIEDIIDYNSEEGIEEIIEILENPDSVDKGTKRFVDAIFGDLLDYAKQMHPHSYAKQVKFMKEHIKSMIGDAQTGVIGRLADLKKGGTSNNALFNALLQAARFSISLTEGILFDAQTGDFFNVKKNDNELDDETESMESQDKEHYMLKYQMQDPMTTLTKRMRYMLSNIPMISYQHGRAQYVFDRFGMKMRMTPEVAFLSILQDFSKINNIREFDQKVKDFVIKSPWFKSVADKITQDADFRNEFYRTFVSKGYSEFVVQDAAGNVVIMNRGMENSEVMSQMEKGYLSGMTLTYDSIYDHEGLANMGKVEKWIKALTVVNDKKTPGAINSASSRIDTLLGTKIVVGTDGKTLTQETKKDPLVQLRDFRKALELLNEGKNPDVENDNFDYSLKNLFNALGIDTDAINMDVLLPTIESFDEVLAYAKEKFDKGEYIVEKDKSGKLLDEETALALAQVYEVQRAFGNISNVSDILFKITKILKEYKAKPTGNYFRNNINYFMSIFNKLPIDHTQFESEKFYHGSTERHSYIAKSYIKLIESNLKNEDFETFMQFIDEKYGQYDFSKVDGKYASSFLREITETNEKGELTDRAKAIRKKFKVVQQLSLGGVGKYDDFSKVSGKDTKNLRKYTIYAYFKTMSTEVNGRSIQLSNYRGPLLSDSGNHMLFTLPNYGNDFDAIVDNLVEVGMQEVHRANHYRNNSKVNVEGLSKAGKKFIFFPMLNYKPVTYTTTEDTGEKTYKSVQKRGSVMDAAIGILNDRSIADSSKSKLIRKLLKQHISELMEDNYKKFIDKTHKQFTQREMSVMVTQINKFLKKEDSVKEGSYEHDEMRNNWDEMTDDEADLTEQDIEDSADSSAMGFTPEQIAELETLEKGKRKAKEREFKLRNEFDALMKKFFYNDFLAQINITELLIGDPALYGANPRNIIKRLKEMNAAGEMMWYLDEKGKEIFERGVYVEDLFETSPTWNRTVEMFIDTSKGTITDKAFIRGAINNFKDICATDGQSLRSLLSFKQMYIQMGGMWNERTERLYQKIIDRKQALTADDIRNLVDIVKPFLRSKETINDNGRTTEIGTQHKNSEYMVDYLFSVMFSRVYANNPRMMGLLKALDQEYTEPDGTKGRIDTIHFHSVVKVGYFNGLNLNYHADKFKSFLKGKEVTINKVGDKNIATYVKEGVDIKFEVSDNLDDTFANYLKAVNNARADQMASNAKLQAKKGISEETFETLYNQFEMTENEISDYIHNKISTGGPSGTSYVHKVPMKDYRIIQPSADHMKDHDGLIGTQLVNVISADFSDQVSIDFGTNKGLNKKKALEVFNEILVAMDRTNFENIKEEFKDSKSLQQALFGKMNKDKQYDIAMYEALELNDDGEFDVPLNHQLIANKLEPLVLSGFKNAIQRKKILGGNVVLTSSYGLRNDLKIKYKEGKEGKVEGIEYIPCYITAPSQNFLNDYLIHDEKNGSYDIDINRMKEEMGEEKANDMLDMIGYRIPTESKFSMVPLRIVGFLPQTNGSAIILPSDIISISGTDFDIDKLFLMRKAYRREIIDKSKLIDSFKKFADANQSDSSYATILQNQSEALKEQEQEEIDTLDEYASDYQDNVKEIQDRYKQERLNLYDQAIASKKEGIDVEKVARFINRYNKEELLTDKEFERLSEQAKSSALKENEKKKQGDLNAAEYAYLQEFISRKEEYQSNYMLEKPQYNTIKPKVVTNPDGSINAQATFKDASMRQLGNSFVEICKGMLRSTEGSRLMMSSANYDNVKRMSRVEQILYNPVVLSAFIKEFGEDNLYQKLSEMDTKALEDFYAENNTQSDPFGFEEFLSNQKNLMDGKELIAVFAVISSRHYKLQNAKLALKNEYKFKLKYGGKTHEVSTVHPEESPFESGLLVSKILSELQTASPDNGKDPCLGDIGANPRTADFLGYLGSLGIPMRVIAAINAFSVNPDVEAGMKAIKGIKGFNFSNLKASDFVLDVERLVKIQAALTLNEGKDIQKVLSKDDITYLGHFSNWFTNAKKASKDLASFSVVGRSDSQSGAIGYKASAVLRNQIKITDYYQKANSKEFAISGLADVVKLDIDESQVSDSPVPHLQADFTYGIIEAQKMAAEYLPDVNDENVSIMVKLNAQIADKFNLEYEQNDRVINQMLNALKLFKMSKGEFIGGNIDEVIARRNFYIHDFPMHFKMFLATHPDIANMPLFKNLKNKTHEEIKFAMINGVGKLQALQYQQDANNLLHEQPSVAQFIQDLYMYALFNDGLNFGKTTVSRTFDINFSKNMKWLNAAGKEVSFVSDLADANNLTLTPEQQDKFIELFLLNNTYLIPSVNKKNALKSGKTETTKAPSIDWEKGTLTLTNEQLREQTNDTFIKDKNGNFQKLFKIVTKNGTRIFRKESYTKGGNLVYKLVEAPEVPFYHIDGYSREKWSQLQGRGAVTKIPSEMKKSSMDSALNTLDDTMPSYNGLENAPDFTGDNLDALDDAMNQMAEAEAAMNNAFKEMENAEKGMQEYENYLNSLSKIMDAASKGETQAPENVC
jgi:hypothetical protein